MEQVDKNTKTTENDIDYLIAKADVPLKDKLKERFCELIADGYSPAASAFYAGYKPCGVSTLVPDKRHQLYGSKLLTDQAVINRILILQHNKYETTNEKVQSLTRVLEDIVYSDMAQYLRSENIKQKDGSTRTNYYLGTPIQNWDKKSRALIINGLDSKGKPRFIDKMWAVEKLMKIYGIGNEGTEHQVEDIENAFRSAGLVDDTDTLNSMDTTTDIFLDPTINQSNEYIKEELPRV